jgi:lactate dehydrogenase-like 2-hydroxyacid dehydrogenase
MTKQKVLFATNPARREVPEVPEFEEFAEQFEIVVHPLISIAQFQKALKEELSDISAIWITKPLLHPKTQFNYFIDYLPPTVKVVALNNVGSDLYDLSKLKSRGIKVCNIGDSPSKDVADMALALALSTFRFTTYFDKVLRKTNGDILEAKRLLGSVEVNSQGDALPAPDERFNWSKFATVGGKYMDSPNGKTAGLVGFGSIGKEIGIRLWALGMKIVYTKRTPLTEEELKILPFIPRCYGSLGEMLPHLDLLVLAVPHSPQTVNLINKDSIKLCKKGLRIVNIGRGSAIDEDVLFEALEDGTVNSVGLDVFQHEPHIDPRFIKRHDVTIIPHLGPFTRDNHRYIAQKSIANIKNVLLEGGDGVHPV